MATETRATTFVTGAVELDGAELIGASWPAAIEWFDLTASVEAARRVRRPGAKPVMEPPGQGFRQAPRSAP